MPMISSTFLFVSSNHSCGKLARCENFWYESIFVFNTVELFPFVGFRGKKRSDMADISTVELRRKIKSKPSCFSFPMSVPNGNPKDLYNY